MKPKLNTSALETSALHNLINLVPGNAYWYTLDGTILSYCQIWCLRIASNGDLAV